MKLTTLSIAAVSAYLNLVTAETVTLSALLLLPTSEVPLPSITYSFIGVGADGSTTYSSNVIISLEYGWPNGQNVYVSDGQTVTVGPETITIPPKTVHATLVADASHYVNSAADIPLDTLINGVVSCDMDGKGGASCVQRGWAPGGPTTTTSYTGPLSPVYTLVVSNSAAGWNTSSGKTVKPWLLALISGGMVSWILCMIYG